MSKELQELANKKNLLYRDQYRRVMGWLLVMLVSCIALALSLTYISISQRKPSYYATTTNGVVIPLHSLSEPVVTNKTLLQWAEIATRAAYNLNFDNYAQQLKKAKVYFTDNGWSAFKKALQNSGLLQNVQNEKLIMSAVVSGAPVILSQAVVSGRYTWRISMPILVTFTSASEKEKRKYIITMNIQRVPVLSDPKGIQISDFESRLDLS